MKKTFGYIVLTLGVLLVTGAGCPQTSVKSSATVTSPTPTEVPGDESNDKREGVMMQNGRMMIKMRDGKSEMMTTDVMLSNGTKIMLNGKVILSDGSSAMMNEGDVVDMEGRKTSRDTMMGIKTETEQTTIEEADQPFIVLGSYEDYAPEKIALAANNKVVLFFKADWCPTCRALDADINAHLSSVPTGTTILKVNYDNSTEQKKKYGVTYQHTFVQVDAQGNMIAKWTGSPTLAELIKKIK